MLLGLGACAHAEDVAAGMAEVPFADVPRFVGGSQRLVERVFTNSPIEFGVPGEEPAGCRRYDRNLEALALAYGAIQFLPQVK